MQEIERLIGQGPAHGRQHERRLHLPGLHRHGRRDPGLHLMHLPRRGEGCFPAFSRDESLFLFSRKKEYGLRLPASASSPQGGLASCWPLPQPRLPFGVTRGEQPLVRCGERGVQRSVSTGSGWCTDRQAKGVDGEAQSAGNTLCISEHLRNASCPLQPPGCVPDWAGAYTKRGGESKHPSHPLAQRSVPPAAACAETVE